MSGKMERQRWRALLPWSVIGLIALGSGILVLSGVSVDKDRSAQFAQPARGLPDNRTEPPLTVMDSDRRDSGDAQYEGVDASERPSATTASPAAGPAVNADYPLVEDDTPMHADLDPDSLDEWLADEAYNEGTYADDIDDLASQEVDPDRIDEWLAEEAAEEDPYAEDDVNWDPEIEAELNGNLASPSMEFEPVRDPVNRDSVVAHPEGAFADEILAGYRDTSEHEDKSASALPDPMLVLEKLNRSTVKQDAVAQQISEGLPKAMEGDKAQGQVELTEVPAESHPPTEADPRSQTE